MSKECLKINFLAFLQLVTGMFVNLEVTVGVFMRLRISDEPCRAITSSDDTSFVQNSPASRHSEILIIFFTTKPRSRCPKMHSIVLLIRCLTQWYQTKCRRPYS